MMIAVTNRERTASAEKRGRMSTRRRRDWTAYGLPQIFTQMYTDDETSAGRGGSTAEDDRPVTTPESRTLYWMQKSAIEVAVGLAANGVPSHTAAELLRSSNIGSTGLMCFEKPIGTVQWGVNAKAVDVPWDAVAWDLLSDKPIARFGERPMFITFMSRMPDHRHLLGPDNRNKPLAIAYVLILDSDEVLLEEGSHDVASMDVALLTSVLLTAGQPRITSQKVLGPADGIVVPRRDRGNVSKTAPEVVLIDLLRRPADSTDTRMNVTGRGREYDHRWWVRGYYKMQPYGPRSELRKSIYVLPHTAGPEDKPLSKRPRVNVIRTDSSAKSTE
jgi:hypothetical protein